MQWTEKTHLLKNRKQEAQSYDYLTNPPAPIQLQILEFIAADSKDKLKIIKAITKTNKHFH